MNDLEPLTSVELRQLRKLYGFSQEGLGKALGKTRGAVQLWEGEKTPPKWLRIWFRGYSCWRAENAQEAFK